MDNNTNNEQFQNTQNINLQNTGAINPNQVNNQSQNINQDIQQDITPVQNTTVANESPNVNDIPNQQQPTPNPQPVYVQPQYTYANNDVPEEYKPISMWGYFGYEILFAIPLIGFILILVFSFGGAKNKNLRNFARSYFCGLIIALIATTIFAIIMLVVGGAASFSKVSNPSNFGANEAARTLY